MGTVTMRVRRDGPTLTIQVKGPATMHHGPPLRQLAQEALAQGAEAVRVDLRHCTYPDSTFLGTMLALRRAAEGKARLEVVSPSLSCRRVFEQMGLDTVYTVVEDDEPAEDWTEVGGEGTDRETFNRTVVQAHEELAQLEGPAGDEFRAVLECLNATEAKPSANG